MAYNYDLGGGIRYDSDEYKKEILKENKDGGPGSGNWGHVGRPGKIGGSGSGGGIKYRTGSKKTGFSSEAKKKAEEKKKNKASGGGGSTSSSKTSKKPSETKSQRTNYKISPSNCKKTTESALKKVGDIDYHFGDSDGYGEGYYEIVTKKSKGEVVNSLKTEYKNAGAKIENEKSNGFSVSDNDYFYSVKVSNNSNGNTYEKGDKNYSVDYEFAE